MAEHNAEYNKCVLEEVVDFNDKFREAALIEHDKFQSLAAKMEQANAEGDTEALENFQADQEAEKPGYLEMMLIHFGEQEGLVTAIEAFKEVFENRVQTVESTINNTIKADWVNIENQIIHDQHTRNRDII